jgi:hypothetical protein
MSLLTTYIVYELLDCYTRCCILAYLCGQTVHPFDSFCNLLWVRPSVHWHYARYTAAVPCYLNYVSGLYRVQHLTQVSLYHSHKHPFYSHKLQLYFGGLPPP